MKKKIHKISILINNIYNSYLKKYNLNNVKSIGSENIQIKNLRYSIILNEILDCTKKFKKVNILDSGFGLGGLYSFIKKKNLLKKIKYEGSEINVNFLKYTRKKFKNNKTFFYSDLINIKLRKKYDFIIFSGTFYHKPMILKYEEYMRYIQKILKLAWNNTNMGIVINFINEDVDYKKRNLFYPKKKELEKLINSLSRFNKKISYYPLFETTYVILKKNFISKIFDKDEFKRYLN